MRAFLKSVLFRLGYEIRSQPLKSRCEGLDKGELPSEWIEPIQGMLSLDEARLLHRLAKAVVTGCVVEVGSFRGRSTVALALGSLSGKSVPVFAIEPHEPFHGPLGGEFGPEDRGAFYQTMLNTGCYKIVRLVNLSTEIVTPGWKQPVGMLWIDGDHSYEGVKRDFECWHPHLQNDAAIVFDDSLNPDIGPRKLIDELTATGRFKETELVGKVTVMREVQ